MANYKPVECNGLFIPVILSEQIVPGTFEFALNHLVDNELDLSSLDARFNNDVTGASAFNPRVMLKIVLLGYSRGLISSRRIALACEQNVQFMAISGDSQPSFSHIAKFVRNLQHVIQPVFKQILMICDAQGLIGKEMFAIDGVKLPSNASKERSGTHAQLKHHADRLDKAAAKILARHRDQDESKSDELLSDKADVQRTKLQREARRIREFLASAQPRLGSKGKEVKSNVTDNDSAKMATSKGVIQGYGAQAAVDSKHQVIVAADVIGAVAEHGALLPMIELTNAVRTDQTLITADAGYSEKRNLKALQKQGIPALIADNQMRKRDEAFADRAKHKAKPNPLHNKTPVQTSTGKYKASEFKYDAALDRVICPMGKPMHHSGRELEAKGVIYNYFKGTIKNCVPCPNRDQCLRTPEKSRIRQVAIALERVDEANNPIVLMRDAIDSVRGRRLYSQRMGTVEPVFANIRYNKQLNRFTLRGKAKVSAQWHLYCLVHNIEKIATVGAQVRLQ